MGPGEREPGAGEVAEDEGDGGHHAAEEREGGVARVEDVAVERGDAARADGRVGQGRERVARRREDAHERRCGCVSGPEEHMLDIWDLGAVLQMQCGLIRGGEGVARDGGYVHHAWVGKHWEPEHVGTPDGAVDSWVGGYRCHLG